MTCRTCMFLAVRCKSEIHKVDPLGGSSCRHRRNVRPGVILRGWLVKGLAPPQPHPEEDRRSVSKDEASPEYTGASFETQTSSAPQDEGEGVTGQTVRAVIVRTWRATWLPPAISSSLSRVWMRPERPASALS